MVVGCVWRCRWATIGLRATGDEGVGFCSVQVRAVETVVAVMVVVVVVVVRRLVLVVVSAVLLQLLLPLLLLVGGWL